MAFLVVQDTRSTPLAEVADVVLAGATFAEKAGCYVNADGRLQYAEAALPPRDGSLPDLDLFAILLGRGAGPIPSHAGPRRARRSRPAFAVAGGGKLPAFGILLGEPRGHGRARGRGGGRSRVQRPLDSVFGRHRRVREMHRSFAVARNPVRLTHPTRNDSMLVLIGILVKVLIVVGVTQGAVAYLILVERKVAAYAQDRIGPNRCRREFGLPFGLLQPLADGAKMLLKEDVIPSYVSKPVFILAPSIAIIAAMIAFAVVPFGPVGPARPGSSSKGRSSSRSRRGSTSGSSTSSRSAAWRSTA